MDGQTFPTRRPGPGRTPNTGPDESPHYISPPPPYYESIINDSCVPAPTSMRYYARSATTTTNTQTRTSSSATILSPCPAYTPLDSDPSHSRRDGNSPPEAHMPQPPSSLSTVGAPATAAIVTPHSTPGLKTNLPMTTASEVAEQSTVRRPPVSEVALQAADDTADSISPPSPWTRPKWSTMSTNTLSSASTSALTQKEGPTQPRGRENEWFNRRLADLKSQYDAAMNAAKTFIAIYEGLQKQNDIFEGVVSKFNEDVVDKKARFLKTKLMMESFIRVAEVLLEQLRPVETYVRDH
ncbi:hypothetical protein C8Q74DRAFT_1236084 [Fomes fomentarius]|nr:hypothetical protein C8Q74DRAFT_1236084 [Fomes fomentarius]